MNTSIDRQEKPAPSIDEKSFDVNLQVQVALKN
jgi:hypothetical protein